MLGKKPDLKLIGSNDCFLYKSRSVIVSARI